MAGEKVLVVEDELFIAEDIAGFLEELGYEIVGIASNATEAINLLKSNTPDIVLLDINIDGVIDGVQIASILKQEYNLPFIYITASTDKGTFDRAKHTDPYGYVIKPFEEKDLEITVELALYKFKTEQAANIDFKDAHKEAVYIKNNNRLIKIKPETIDWIEAFDNYCFIYTDGEKHLVTQTLKTLEAKVTSPTLFRVHRSFIINTLKIDYIENNRIYINNYEIPIGKSYKEVIMNKIRII